MTASSQSQCHTDNRMVHFYKQLPIHIRDVHSHVIHCSMGPCESDDIQHVSWFSHFCRVRGHVWQTNTHTHTCRRHLDEREMWSGWCGSTAGWPPSLRCEIFNVRRRRAPSSHVSNETYSESNGRVDPRRLVSTAVTWRVSRKCLKWLAGSVSPGFGSEFSLS